MWQPPVRRGNVALFKHVQGKLSSLICIRQVGFRQPQRKEGVPTSSTVSSKIVESEKLMHRLGKPKSHGIERSLLGTMDRGFDSCQRRAIDVLSMSIRS